MTDRRRNAGALAAGFVVAWGVGVRDADGAVVTVAAGRDSTLYEHATGSVGNGAGQYLFSGVNSTGVRRRAALWFDVGAAVPTGAVVTSVELRLRASRVSGDADVIALHSLLRSWGEGASDPAGEEGAGAAATAGDATWLHAFHSDELWDSPGGDFAPAALASALVAGEGIQTWSSEAMAAQVSAWLHDPSTNFGWLLVGGESTPGVVKRFDSRESAEEGAGPALVIEYTAVPGVGVAPALGAMSLAAWLRRRRR